MYMKYDINVIDVFKKEVYSNKSIFNLKEYINLYSKYSLIYLNVINYTAIFA